MEQYNKSYDENPTQEKLTDFLLEKIKKYKNVSIKTYAIENTHGKYYNIKITANLEGYRNNLFYVVKLNTVSHSSRVINIKCIFTDNDNLKKDMKINADAIIQCFRAVAPDTIVDVYLDTFKDKQNYEHLFVNAKTIKNASIIYVYKRVMDFINVINDKYGQIPLEPYIETPLPITTNEIIETNKSTENTNIQTTITNNNVDNKLSYANITKKKPENNNSSIITNLTNITNIITNKTELDIQEEFLLKQLENIKKLKQLKQLKNTN